MRLEHLQPPSRTSGEAMGALDPGQDISQYGDGAVLA
jgi:hypothetical protein